MTWHACAVVANHESKIVRYTDLACHLEAGARRGHVAYPAIDTGGAVEDGAARLECPPTLYFATFFHCCLRRRWHPHSLRGLAMARSSDGNGRSQAKLGSLSDSEKGHQKADKAFTKH